MEGSPSVIRLVERRRDLQTVMQLQDLLQQAMEGKIVGLVASVHYGGCEFGYIGSGSMCNNPAVGIAAAQKLATKMLHLNK